MGFFKDVLNVITFVPRHIIKGAGIAGKFLVKGLGAFAEVALDEFPEEFIGLAVAKIRGLEPVDLTNKDKRDEFIEWAEDYGKATGKQWGENTVRALLEILLLQIRKDDD